MSEDSIVVFADSPGHLNLVGAKVIADPTDFAGIHHAARALAEDFGRVKRGKASSFELVHEGRLDAPTAIIIGCIESCWMIRELRKAGKIETASIRGKWESFITCVVDDPLPGCARALVIAGSDKRGAIFGAYTLSSQIGVSPYVTVLTLLIPITLTSCSLEKMVLVCRRPCTVPSRVICASSTHYPGRAEHPVPWDFHQ
jgi:hypothetical protein